MPQRMKILHAFLISTLFLATPIFAEQLEANWQTRRDYYNKIVDQACAGDKNAYDLLYKDATEKQDPVALHNLAWIFQNQSCNFSRTDLQSHAMVYSASANAGYPLAHSNYAKILMEGKGTMRQPELALKHFQKAIDAGYGNAAVSLGLYYTGSEFLAIDTVKATELYRRAIQEGADPSQIAKLASAIEQLRNEYVAAFNYVRDEFRFVFTPTDDKKAIVRQTFEMRDENCVVRVVRTQSNNDLFVQEVNLGRLSPSYMPLKSININGRKTSILEAAGVGYDTPVKNWWIKGADLAEVFETERIIFIIANKQNYSEVSAKLELMIGHCSGSTQ